MWHTAQVWFRFGIATAVVGSLLVSLSPSSVAAQTQESDASFTYVALGDSFSSGEGNPEFQEGSHSGLFEEDNHCHRADVAYPELFREASPAIENLVFRACSGAVVADVRLGQYNEGSQLSSLNSQTDVVTLTIGGNDMRFAKILKKCFPLDDWANCWTRDKDHLQRVFDDELTTLGPRLQSLYEEILRLTENRAAVFVLAYPQIFPKLRNGRCPGRLYGFTQGEIDRIRKAFKKVNNVIEIFADRAGVEFVNTENAFVGHSLCSKNPYANELILEHGKVYSFHPNAKGHRALAEHLGSLAVIDTGESFGPLILESSTIEDAHYLFGQPDVDQQLDGMVCDGYSSAFYADRGLIVEYFKERSDRVWAASIRKPKTKTKQGEVLRWITDQGLTVGATEARMKVLYPGAQDEGMTPDGATFWDLERTADGYLRAQTKDGEVVHLSTQADIQC